MIPTSDVTFNLRTMENELGYIFTSLFGYNVTKKVITLAVNNFLLLV